MVRSIQGPCRVAGVDTELAGGHLEDGGLAELAAQGEGGLPVEGSRWWQQSKVAMPARP